MADTIVSPAEFEKIPLEYIIASPLMTTIQAHRMAAETTMNFVEDLKEAGSTEFTVQVKNITQDAEGNNVETFEDRVIKAPYLALVKVPSLNFDSLSVEFNYNISQVHKDKKTTTGGFSAKVATKGVAKAFVDASITGNFQRTRNEEMTGSRSGGMSVKLHVSESALPAGLQKIIDAMTDGIQAQAATGGQQGGQGGGVPQ